MLRIAELALLFTLAGCIVDESNDDNPVAMRTESAVATTRTSVLEAESPQGDELTIQPLGTETIDATTTSSSTTLPPADDSIPAEPLPGQTTMDPQ